MDGNIFNSQGVLVAVVLGSSIYGLRGQKLYDLKGTKIYKLSGELVGHLANVKSASERHLDRATEKLFPAS
jgi:hypothetical protein